MFKVLILQASHSLSDERTEYLIKDRLSFMRFLGLTLADRVPDANSIWNFRESLTRTIVDGKPAIEVLFKRFDAALAQAGFLAMGGQIIDATIVAAPRQRNTEAEKKAIKEGCIPEDWKAKPAKLRQKDRDARWTVKFTKAKPAEDGAKRVDIAIPAFGYKNHIGIDRVHGLIRTWRATDAARHDGAQLPNLIDKQNTASDVWAKRAKGSVKRSLMEWRTEGDTAYRSAKNEEHMIRNGLRSQIHRKKPKGKPMPEAIARANGKKSKVRAFVEHVFARQKGPIVHPHHWAGSGNNENWPRQSHLQHETNDLADVPASDGINRPERPAQPNGAPYAIKSSPRSSDNPAARVSPGVNRESVRKNTVIGGVQHHVAHVARPRRADENAVEFIGEGANERYQRGKHQIFVRLDLHLRIGRQKRDKDIAEEQRGHRQSRRENETPQCRQSYGSVTNIAASRAPSDWPHICSAAVAKPSRKKAATRTRFAKSHCPRERCRRPARLAR